MMRNLARRLNDLLRKRGGLSRPDDVEGLAGDLAAVLSYEEGLDVIAILSRAHPPQIDEFGQPSSAEVVEAMMAIVGERRKDVAEELREKLYRWRLRERLLALRKVKGEGEA